MDKENHPEIGPLLHYILMYHCVQVFGFAFVFWGALFEERVDALQIVGALVDLGAVGVDAFEALRRQHGGRLAQYAKLSLDGADGHDAVAAQGIQELFL